MSWQYDNINKKILTTLLIYDSIRLASSSVGAYVTPGTGKRAPTLGSFV